MKSPIRYTITFGDILDLYYLTDDLYITLDYHCNIYNVETKENDNIDYNLYIKICDYKSKSITNKYLKNLIKDKILKAIYRKLYSKDYYFLYNDIIIIYLNEEEYLIDILDGVYIQDDFISNREYKLLKPQQILLK